MCDDEEDLPSTTTNTSSTCAVLNVPASTMCSIDGSKEEEDGQDSEESDSADTGPNRECSTKRLPWLPVSSAEGGRRERDHLYWYTKLV